MQAELKLKGTKYCVLSAAGNGNTNATPMTIFFTVKNGKVYVPVVTVSPKDNQNLFWKGFERSFYWNEFKTKS